MKGGRSPYIIKAEAAWRATLLRTATQIFPSLIITEFPKSGASWLSAMMSELTGLPYPRNRFPRFGPNIYQGHSLRAQKAPTLVLWRDPRDILVSLYHFKYFKTDFQTEARVAISRAHAGFEDFGDVIGNMPKFIKLVFSDPIIPRFTWNTFFDTWHQAPNVVHSSYERVRTNGPAELARLTSAFGYHPGGEAIERVLERHSFKKVSGRNEGTENKNSFLRKGIVGDWVNIFSPEAILELEHATQGRLASYNAHISDLPDLPSTSD